MKKILVVLSVVLFASSASYAQFATVQLSGPNILVSGNMHYVDGNTIYTLTIQGKPIKNVVSWTWVSNDADSGPYPIPYYTSINSAGVATHSFITPTNYNPNGTFALSGILSIGVEYTDGTWGIGSVPLYVRPSATNPGGGGSDPGDGESGNL